MVLSRALVAVVLSVLLAGAHSSGGVQIEIHPEMYTAHTYPHSRPPPRLSNPFPNLEAGFCRTIIRPQTRVNLQWRRLGVDTVTATVTLVQIIASMKIDIFLEDGSGPRVATHEATHRAISQHYYAQTEAVAREIGNSVIGRMVPLSSRRQKADAAAAIDQIEREILAALTWRIADRCEFAQRRFDEITDHARNPIANEVAVRQALAEEAAHWDTLKNAPPPGAQASPRAFTITANQAQRAPRHPFSERIRSTLATLATTGSKRT